MAMRMMIGQPTALGQSTAAMQWAFAKASGARGGRTSARRRRKKAASITPRRAKRKRATARRSTRSARMVKGSSAAKRYMAKLRKMRRRKR